MSTTTDVLSLFKYDPVADADSTFNITQGLNNNWDKLDAAILLAIAAAGAYNPEESYAVGDYCTYKGKLRKCSTAIPTGETWTEAHWTTTTVAAELAELSSQLSNRLRRYTSFEDLGLTEATATVASIVTAMGNNSMFAVACATDGKTAGWLPESYGFLRIHKVNNYYAMAEYQVVWPNAELWRGYYNAGDDGLKWSGWQPIPTATKPQEFDLPLAEEMQPFPDFGSNKYWKNQFNEVTLTLSVTKTDMNTNDIENSSLLATLPAGFRPATIVSGAAFVDRGAESVVYPAFIAIHPDGSVIMNQSNGVSCSMVIASMSFLAAG